MRRQLRMLLTVAPAFCAFAMAILGCLGAAYCFWWLPLLCAPLVLMGWRGCGVSWTAAAVLSLVLTAAGINAAFALAGACQGYLEILPRQGNCHVEARLRLVEVQFCEGRLETLSKRTSMTADILALRMLSHSEWQPTNGHVVFFPDGDCAPFPMREMLPGRMITVRGTLRIPSADPPLGFYPRHLGSRGIWRQLIVSDFSLDRWDKGMVSRWRRLLHRVRTAMALRMISGIDDDATAGKVLALGLGMSQFIPDEARQLQVASGTVHVFAISGMHLAFVTMLAAVALRWSLRSLTFQWLSTAAVALGYVLLTGMSTSALRAFLMVLVVIYARMRFRTPSWLNALGVTGCLALTFRPLAVFDLGFVYSYSVMTVLLLSAPLLEKMGACMTEPLNWQPRETRSHRRNAIGCRIAQGVTGAVLAWLCSSGTALALNSRITLFSPLYNIPLATMVFLALVCCPVRLVLGMFFPAWDGIWASGLAMSMRLMSAVAEAGGKGSSCLTVAGYGAVQCVLFHGALVLWLLASYDSTPEA